jgi:transposase
VLTRGSQLMDLHGVGPAGAARILVDVGTVARSPPARGSRPGLERNAAPLDASSGTQIRHRLSRAGNR